MNNCQQTVIPGIVLLLFIKSGFLVYACVISVYSLQRCIYKRFILEKLFKALWYNLLCDRKGMLTYLAFVSTKYSVSLSVHAGHVTTIICGILVNFTSRKCFMLSGQGLFRGQGHTSVCCFWVDYHILRQFLFFMLKFVLGWFC